MTEDTISPGDRPAIEPPVTDPRRAEAALVAALDAAADIVLITDQDGVIEYVNRAFTQVTGYAPNEAIGQTPRILKSGKHDAQFYKKMWDTILSGAVWTGALSNRRKDGTEYVGRMTITPLPADPDGKARFIAIGTDDTERVQAEEALRRSERALVEAQRIAHLGNWDWDVVTNELQWSDEIYRIFGLAPQQFSETYEAFLAAVHPDDRDHVDRSVDKALLEQEPYDIEHRIVRADGMERIVHELGEVSFDDEDRAIRMAGTVQDITERKLAENDLRASEARHRAFVDAVPDMFYRISVDGTLLDFSRGVGGLWFRDVAPGRTIEEAHAPGFVHVVKNAVTAAIKEQRVLEREFQLTWEDGVHDYEARFVATGTDEVVVIVRDITERRRAREEMDRLASTDALTGLPNRARLGTILDEAMREAAENDRQGALIYVDLDRTELVNASHGHAVGDQLLRAIGRALARGIRRTDVVARAAGDEFAVILRDCDRGAVQYSAEQLLARVSAVRIPVGEESVSTTASVGVVGFPMQHASTDDLIVLAHTAAHSAKEEGRNRVQLFDPAAGRREALSDLQQKRVVIASALDADRLRLVRQPIVSVSSGDVAMYEVLARLEDEDGTIRLPGEFIPQAEALDMVERIDRRVLEGTCERWRRYADAGEELKLTVNVSGRSIGPDMVRLIRSLAEQWRVPPEALVIEVTETAAARGGTSVGSFFSGLRGHGFGVAVDDFGSGNTSLKALRDVPIDFLKIDGSLIRELPSSPRDQEYVRAFSVVAHATDIAMVAEHVEDGETMGLLAEYGVEYAQGYHLGRPEEFPAEPVVA